MVKEFIQQKTNQTDGRKMIFEDEDGIEIFEAKEPAQTSEEIEVINLNKKQKTRPNDPCPCWSGKKYKKCCHRFAHNTHTHN